MTSQLLICSRRSDGQSSARSQTPFAFNDSLSHAIHITFCCWQFVIDAQTKRFIVYQHTDSQHTDTVKFEIPYGQQNSFKAETDLIQRSLASTLKWPHYKFTSGETHWHINPVHMPVVWISYWAEFYFFICNRLSDRHASTKSGSAICVQWFTDSCNSHYISQLPCYFMDSRTERFSTESRLSLLDIQTQLNFEIANVQQNSFTAETNLIQRRLASTLK